MAQAQLNAAHFSLTENGICCLSYQFNRKQITCCLDENQSVIIRRSNHSTDIILKIGQKRITLPLDLFETLCDLKISIKLLSSFLEGNISTGK